VPTPLVAGSSFLIKSRSIPLRVHLTTIRRL
jgi:hypothetical protein